MSKIYYPAKIYKEDGEYTVEFLDFKNMVTHGKDIQEAYEMAQDLLYMLVEEYTTQMPKATVDYSEVEMKKGEIITLIELDIEQYAEQVSTKMVNTTVTMPKWMKLAAEKEKLNFSKLLRESIMNNLKGTVLYLEREECSER